ncbi:MAG: hypothetical protein J6N49_06000 [Alphaproteobacteria bacterium]|nr:hypothetical protein [Alphaproteobacteria bacterium]
MSKKSLFKNFFSLFADKKSVVVSKNISKAEAINLQQEYIADSHAQNTDFLPPYLDILKQLDDPKPEIFTAALYYLGQIARNESHHRAGIIEKLTAKSNDKKLSDEQKKQILQLLDTIK